MSFRRAAIAGVLAMVYPGLGHLYLREWIRAIAWFGIGIATAALVMPDEAVQAVQSGGFDALLEVSRNLPTDTVVALLVIRVFTAIDAVLLALRVGPAASEEPEGPVCPNCGREIDGDIDFCHWCTTRLETVSEESQT